jgi:hypothetical protein
MKTLLGVLLMCCAASAYAADSDEPKTSVVAVPDGGALDVITPAGWTFAKVQLDPSLPPTVRMSSANGDASLQVTLLVDKVGGFGTKEKMEEVVKGAAQQYVGGSVENKVTLQSLESPNGKCVLAEFTDADLVGKPSGPGQYKVVATGILVLGKTVGAVTLLGDSFNDKSYLAGKKILTAGIAVHK